MVHHRRVPPMSPNRQETQLSGCVASLGQCAKISQRAWLPHWACFCVPSGPRSSANWPAVYSLKSGHAYVLSMSLYACFETRGIRQQARNRTNKYLIHTHYWHQNVLDSHFDANWLCRICVCVGRQTHIIVSDGDFIVHNNEVNWTRTIIISRQ